MKKYFLFLIIVVNAPAFGQDISGYWQGVLYRPGSYLSYSMQLFQNHTTDSIVGTTVIKVPNNTVNYGIHNLLGKISSDTFTFKTFYIGIGPPPLFTFWCNLIGRLTYDSVLEKMQGPWWSNAYFSCPGGTIEVWRLKLTSDSIFCEGQPINLTVTGQNIRWYRDSSLANLLDTGNTYLPVINTTTKFYVTQTHYNIESPLLPIKIMIKPKTYSSITQSICEGDTFMGHTSSGIYFDTLVNSVGCDSIRKLTLIVNPRTYSSFTQTICEGDSFMGYTTSGIYIDTLVNSKGCDSIRTINLAVKTGIKFTFNHTICEGEAFLGYHSTGIYYDTFTVANNCDSIRILNLTVLPLNRRKVNKRICEGERYFAGSTYQTNSGLYYDTIHSNIGCDTIVETNLIVSPLLKPDLGPDKNMCIGDSTVLNAGNYLNYLWSNGTTMSTLQIKGPGKFWVRVSDRDGCKGFDTITIQQVDCKTIKIPNAFSPNRDGVNDTWIIQGLQGYQNCRVQIFDRYGQIVFSSNGYANPWDGKSFNNYPLPIGTYYYVITLGKFNYTGSVSIIR